MRPFKASWNGSDRAILLELAGNKLTMSVGPVKNAYTGKDILLVSTLERVECDAFLVPL
jgi:hypothetical protein